MFGYVVINKPELKFKEFDVYKSFYCGLCYSLRSRYGFVGQFTLSYDMTFLVMLLTSLYEPKVAHSEHKCIRHPLKAQPMSSSIYSDYVADMNILLSYYKAMDDWNDDRSVLKLAFAKLLNTKHPDDSFDYAAKADSISSLLTELGTREKENETNIDVMAGLFGRIMSVLFVPKDDQWAASLSRIGFFLYVVNVSGVVEVGADYQSAVLHRAAVYGVQLVAVRHYALHPACLYPCDCVVAEREVFGAPDCLITVYVRCEACFRGLVGRPGIVVVRFVYLSP